MLTSKVIKRLSIPGEPGEWVEIRLLSWDQLEQAKQVRLRTIMRQAREMDADGFASLGAALSNARAAAPVEIPRAAEYDRGTLLRLAIVGWSYDVQVTPENVADLDLATADWLEEAILAPTSPSEADRKNG